MEESINPSPVPSNCTSPVCSDPAHDDLALHAEWSDESSDCVGDGPHRDGRDDREDRDDPEDLDDFDEDEGRGIDVRDAYDVRPVQYTPRNVRRSLTPRRIFSPTPGYKERKSWPTKKYVSPSARPRRAGGVSELPNRYANKYQSPASVAAAIDDMADAIVTKAAQKAKEAIENAACNNPETKLQSALG